MAGFLSNLFNGDRKILNEIEKIAHEIDALADETRALSDEALKEKTNEFKNRIAQGESLDDLLVEAYAVSREAAYRVIGEFPYVVQLMGAIILHRGDIAEMKTGEGKTLTAIMPTYLNALEGKGVHVITVNEYLAQRDAEWMGEIHRFLGLTVGINVRALSPSGKREVYECDITYTTNSEVGFDYLRDNMVTKVEQRVLRPLNYALVDEVDSILIDESRTPLIISGGARDGAKLYESSDKFAKKLSEGSDYVIDVKSKTVQLTEAGVEKAERTFKVDNLYDLDNTSLVHHINNALKANYIMLNDIEYVVQNNEVVIVDQFTGRLMEGREYSDGLHQALCAKEGVTIKQETVTLATVTYQNFFRLYNKLSGMTGTAKTEEEEFLEIYNMRVLEVPTNRPIAREDLPDLVYGTRKAKFEALIETVRELNEKGQPVLVGTVAVETSEYLSMMMKQRKIKHEVLNAKNHAREAQIIEKAGRKGSVTIATNMAGRGTDIKLDEESRALGGLAVLGSERHESRRIDNQLRGRSGRQGDPGMSRFFVSFEDDLMLRHGSERFENVYSQLGDVAIENKVITKQISAAQRRVEGVNFDIRKTLLDYDDVLRQQREIIYEQRDYVLENEDVHGIIKEMYKRVVSDTIASYTIPESKDFSIDKEGLVGALDKLGLIDDSFDQSSLDNASQEEIQAIITDAAWEKYEIKITDVQDQFTRVEKEVVLNMIDRSWVDHIDAMSKLREGIHLRSYAQDKPLQAYVTEGFEMFEEMLGQIAQDIVMFCVNVKIEYRQ
ncbi:preprotein translocase subunit SecA [Erysipelothrix rhusiopathiae]|uniref:Protein translocase subunit SecA n=1 Tax=Erysipelothrix rhusiopathiae ATCC 19414 TaxID=525280 RepID=E7FX64_ERYRH|nr:preprotein translocase subunit SecA [Erysipelothrix rhusiopathiae]EFY08712.1 preprotein translocase, SecA subunit [Erysipelothrix rhusiopathiae ATCC 19414]MDE8227851.1 preprotein translocase subunit SecA [Erysipelothrix rhusiopathiae]MDE8338974.1 preprotein translocase subunit SecA [Erysipelothrix rhusiopathiae]MDE8341421.1 preprotein translocase subunit SecA [Erysipelothrix rhusiopathiae]MDV7680635.1 preprotein translocase subunit SecA [Erysipelothrix rhusiopathiae]